MFLSRATYAARAWYDLVEGREKLLGKLASVQRSVLIGVTQAYRTASADALPVVAEVFPIRIALQERVAVSKVKKGLGAKIGDLTIAAGELPQGYRSMIRTDALNLWQAYWSSAAHGVLTRLFVPDVRTRYQARWVSPGYYVTQFMVGQGDFAAWLSTRGLADSELCSCGTGGTVQHVLMNCPHYDTHRVALLSDISCVRREWPEVAGQLVKHSTFKSFVKYVAEVLSLKEAKRRKVRDALRSQQLGLSEPVVWRYGPAILRGELRLSRSKLE